MHDFRKDFDAILVGANTVIRDNPQLTIRRVHSDRQPLRIVVDPNNRIDSYSLILNDEFETLHLTSEFNGISSLLNKLGDMEIQTLLVEGGPTTIRNFLDEGHVSKIYVVNSEITHSEPVDSGINREMLENIGFELLNTEKWGEEIVEVFSQKE